MKRLLLLFSYLLLNFNSFSQITIAQWNFDASTAVPTTIATNASATNVVYGSGITGTPAYFGGNPSSGKGISNTGWNVTSIDLTKYLEVTITPSAGFAFNLTSFKFDGLRSSTGAANWVVRSSIDNFATDIMTGTIGTGFSTNTISLSSPSYQSLNSIIKVRIYGYGATASAGTFRVDNITFSGSINSSSPSLTATPTTLSNLNYFSGSGPSTASSFTLSGSSLTPTADNITVTAPTNFEVSISSTTGFANSLTIPYTSGALSATVYARLKAGLADATYSGNVTFAGGDVTTTPTVALSGTVSPPSPTITLSPTSITGLTYVVGTGPSTGSAYSVSGTYLSPTSGNISVVAPTNFELSTTSAGTYSDNLTIPYTGGALSATTLFVRLKAGLTQNSYSGNIGHTGGGVVTATNVAVSGVVTNSGTGPCGTSTPIGTARGNINGTVVTVQGRLSVDTEFGPNLIYIQDGNGTAGTGGIEVYFSSGNAALGSSINTGDEVQVTGPLAVFNGNLEILNPTCFVKTSAPNQSITPFVINIAEISLHPGELIKIENVNIGDEIPTPTSATTKFLAAKNYSFSTTSPVAIAELRIDANTLFPNTTRPTTTTSIVAIPNRFVSGTTDKYQVYPRNVDDIPGTTGGGGGSGACTTLGFSSVPVAQTLEVTNWNVEWLGNTTGGARPLGPTNEAQQMTNVMTVLNTLQSDVYCIEEVCDHTQFIARVGTDMPGYGAKCSTTYYSHFFDDPEIPGDATSYAQKVCFVYKTAIVSPINAETTPLLSDVYTYPPGNNWASGRLPYMFVANVTVNGMTKKMNFVGLHAKSGADATSYNRRKQDCIDLKTKLDAAYPNANLVILGDYNDDLDVSINVTGGTNPSTYANFVADNTNYIQISKVLSDCGVSSTAKYPDIIDHFMGSNELGVYPVSNIAPTPPSSGIYYLENTVNVARPISYVASYTTSTSDHYPVTARFSFGVPTATAPATITSIGSGNWSSSSTWDCGCVPTSASNVVVNTSHTVTVNTTSQAKSINLKGILSYLSPFVLTLGQ